MYRTSLLALGLLAAAPAIADPTLVSSVPADNAAIAKTDQLSLSFSEAVDPKTTSVELVMTSMPGMAMHGTMRMGGYRLVPASDGKSFVVKFRSPLAAGGYSLAWKTSGKSGQGAGGAVHFTVQ